MMQTMMTVCVFTVPDLPTKKCLDITQKSEHRTGKQGTLKPECTAGWSAEKSVTEVSSHYFSVTLPVAQLWNSADEVKVKAQSCPLITGQAQMLVHFTRQCGEAGLILQSLQDHVLEPKWLGFEFHVRKHGYSGKYFQVLYFTCYRA